MAAGTDRASPVQACTRAAGKTLTVSAVSGVCTDVQIKWRIFIDVFGLGRGGWSYALAGMADTCDSILISSGKAGIIPVLHTGRR